MGGAWLIITVRVPIIETLWYKMSYPSLSSRLRMYLTAPTGLPSSLLPRDTGNMEDMGYALDPGGGGREGRGGEIEGR